MAVARTKHRHAAHPMGDVQLVDLSQRSQHLLCDAQAFPEVLFWAVLPGRREVAANDVRERAAKLEHHQVNDQLAPHPTAGVVDAVAVVVAHHLTHATCRGGHSLVMGAGAAGAAGALRGGRRGLGVWIERLAVRQEHVYQSDAAFHVGHCSVHQERRKHC